MAGLKHPVTPDGRYFVVRGKLWRMANPNLTCGAVRTCCAQAVAAAGESVAAIMKPLNRTEAAIRNRARTLKIKFARVRLGPKAKGK